MIINKLRELFNKKQEEPEDDTLNKDTLWHWVKYIKQGHRIRIYSHVFPTEYVEATVRCHEYQSLMVFTDEGEDWGFVYDLPVSKIEIWEEEE